MTTLTVENYLKATLLTTQRTGVEWVATGQLAVALEVSPGTVTSMMKTLSEAGHAEYRPYEGVRLTDEGRLVAMRMLRRHRLIELFLHKTLGLSWDQVHEEAENMEHAVSDTLIDRIDEFLGWPDTDPHGDPIPSSNGQMRSKLDLAMPLATMTPGTAFKIVRVVDQEGSFLRFLTDCGVSLQSQGVVIDNRPEAGVMTTRFASGPVSLGLHAARQILAEPVDGADQCGQE